MNTGHDGSLSTCHANGPADALRRLETMALMGDVAVPLAAVREQLSSAVDLVVQVARRPGGSREVAEVAELGPPGEVCRLGGGSGLERLPSRPARSPSVPPPSQGWLGR